MKILEAYFSPEKFGNINVDAEALKATVVSAKSAGWKSAVPEEYWDTDPCRVKSSRKETVFRDPPSGIYVYGKSGAQKTRALLCLLAKEYMDGRSISFVTQEQFAIAAYDSFEPDGTGRSLLEKSGSCDVLLIDDMFKRKMTEAQEFFLYCVLERRGRKKTLFTSNIAFGDIPSVFTAKGCANTCEPIMRRIRERCRVLKFS
jgi:DNA replication protein DnaC